MDIIAKIDDLCRELNLTRAKAIEKWFFYTSDDDHESEEIKAGERLKKQFQRAKGKPVDQVKGDLLSLYNYLNTLLLERKGLHKPILMLIDDELDPIEKSDFKRASKALLDTIPEDEFDCD